MAAKPQKKISAPSYGKLLGELRHTFQTGKTRSLDWREQQLKQLIRLLEEQEEALERAVIEDLGKPQVEAYTSEVGFVKAEARHALKHFRKWARPVKMSTPLFLKPGSSRVEYEPLGVILNISAWNYPVHLSLGPIVGAIAAGNCCVIKPSELAPAASRTIAELVPRYLDPQAVRVVEGGIPETTALLEESWDHIFYTGNGSVARIIMAAAARHLTPVTLELGGKSPVFVDKSAALGVAARRIAWAKAFNAGQSCVAPDYVLVEHEIKDKFIELLGKTFQSFLGTDASKSEDYGRIINERHFDRILGLVDKQNVVYGGGADRTSLFIEPTIVDEPAVDSPLMTEEIFGPVVPILAVSDIEEAIEFINGRDKPLALYIYSENKRNHERILRRTSSGGVCINGSMYQLSNPSLPFGGVGASGMGNYHGEYGFRCFSHERAVLVRGTRIDPKQAYPPYDDATRRMMKKLM